MNISAIRASLLCLLSLSPVLIGCGGARVSFGDEPSLDSLQITPSPIALTVGQSMQLAVTASYSDGSKSVLTSEVTWTTSQSLATVASPGTLTCSKSASVTVTAKYRNQSASAPVTCSPAVSAPEPLFSITPQSIHLSTPDPLQLHLTESIPNGAGTDLTSSAKWATKGTVAAIDASGSLLCKAAGQDVVTATYTTNTIDSAVVCDESAVTKSLQGPLQLTLPGARTPVGYTITARLSTSAADGATNVSTQANWSVSPSATATVLSGVVKCTTAGSVTVTASYASQTTSASLICAPAPFQRATSFIEQADEFNGPFSNWLNAKQMGAAGDGVTDDTRALQSALDALRPDTAGTRVLYLPPGRYKVSSELRVNQASYVNVLGEDPATTSIVWSGAAGGSILNLDGSTAVRVIRLTLDGSGAASAGIALTRSTPNGLYSSGIQLSDLRLVGVTTGLNLQITAETTIERVFFDHNTTGISLGDPNNINIFIRDSVFSHCGTGISNYQGAGVFNVSDSFFDHSAVADMHIQNTGFFAARRNVSIGSGAFFLSELVGANNAQITVQDNTVLDTTGTPVVLGNTGPLMLIDNTFRMLDATAPVLTAWDGRSPSDPMTQASAAFLFGNIYSTAHPIGSFDGQVTQYDDATVDSTSIPTPTIPGMVYVPPAVNRLVFEVPRNSTDVEIQAAVDAAAASQTVKPIVHMPQGGYKLQKTVVFPPNSDIQLVGDGLNITKLYWVGPSKGTAMMLPHTHTKLSNFTLTTWEYQYGDHVSPAPGALDGLLYTIDDQPAERIVADQLLLEGGNVQAFFSDGIEHATTNLFATYMLGSQNGIGVTGGAFRAAGQATLGKTDYLTGSMQSLGNATSLNVSAKGRLLVQDNWHDADASSPHNFELSGSGTLTEQGGAAYMRADPSFVTNNFDGDITMMGLSVVGGFGMQNTSASTNLLTVGLAGVSSHFLAAGDASITTGNVIDGYYSNGYSQIASQTPDVGWMRRMLGQLRAEMPVTLGTGDNASEARLDRVEVLGMSNGVHVQGGTAHSGLYVTIAGSTGFLSALSGQCASEIPQSSGDAGRWVFMPGGEGDYVISPIGHQELALGAVLSANGSWQAALSPVTTGYEQRWNIQMGPAGSFQFVNRGTALVLQQYGAAAGCAGLAINSDAPTTFWSVQAR